MKGKRADAVADIDLSAQRILLVDDVPFARATVGRILQGLGEPTVFEASDGYEAMSIIEASPEDVSMVIADFNMPRMNGLQLLKAIRLGEAGFRRDLPVALLTGYSERHLVDTAARLDVNAFLIKPVSRDALGRRLRKVIDLSVDGSWLKAPEAYRNVRVDVGEDDAGAASTETLPSDSNGKMTAGRPRAAQSGRAARAAMRSKGRFTDDELPSTGLAGRFRHEDLATPELLGRFTVLKGKLRGSKLASEITRGVERMAAECGSEATLRVVSALDELAKSDRLSAEDLAAAFTQTLPETSVVAADSATGSIDMPRAGATFVAVTAIPDGAILAFALHTHDGSLLITEGTPLTASVAGIVQTLARRGLLRLEPPPADASTTEPGLYVRFGGLRSITDAEIAAVDPSELRPGAVVGHDIYLPDGRMYMRAGTVLTPRLISLLQDLVALDRLEGRVWVLK